MMENVFIVRHSHRFGHSVWPVFLNISEEEVIEELRSNGDWEDDRNDDEEIEIYGPFPLPKLIEFSDKELNVELGRREAARRVGLCDACSKWYDEPSCGSSRHSAASEQWYRRWRFDYGSSYLTARKPKDRKTIITISRYGTNIRLFGNPEPEAIAISSTGDPEADIRPDGSWMIAETELPIDYTDDYPRSCMSDDERIKWAIDWAIKELENRSESKAETNKSENNDYKERNR